MNPARMIRLARIARSWFSEPAKSLLAANWTVRNGISTQALRSEMDGCRPEGEMQTGRRVPERHRPRFVGWAGQNVQHSIALPRAGLRRSHSKLFRMRPENRSYRSRATG